MKPVCLVWCRSRHRVSCSTPLCQTRSRTASCQRRRRWVRSKSCSSIWAPKCPTSADAEHKDCKAAIAGTRMVEGPTVDLTWPYLSDVRAKTGLEVTILISNPRLFAAPRVVSEPVQPIDILPTLADLTGIPDLVFRDGTSIVGLIEGTSESPGERLTFVEGRPVEPTRPRLRRPASDPIPHYRTYLPGLSGIWRSVRSATHKLIYIHTEETGCRMGVLQHCE